MNRVGVGCPGKDGVCSCSRKRREEWRLGHHKGKQQKWLFTTDGKAAGDVCVEEEWDENKETENLVTSGALWSKTRSWAELIQMCGFIAVNVIPEEKGGGL